MKNVKTSSDTRMRILDAANRVVLDKGAGALTLDAVARQAGVSKGGLLYHFPDKDSLITGMMERLIAKFEAAIQIEINPCDMESPGSRGGRNAVSRGRSRSLREPPAPAGGGSTEKKGNWLAAYIRASFKPDPDREKISRALLAAIATNPGLLGPLQKKFREWQSKSESAAGSCEMGTVIRLALDGMWIADLLDFAPPKAALKKKLLNTILKLAKEGA